MSQTHAGSTWTSDIINVDGKRIIVVSVKTSEDVDDVSRLCASKFHVRGFRKWKTPFEIVMQRHGRQILALTQETLLLRYAGDVMRLAMKSAAVMPVDDKLDIDQAKLTPENNFAFHMRKEICAP